MRESDMIVKTFTAPNLVKALWLLNEDLGSNAVILKTRINNTRNNPCKPLQFVELTAFSDSTLRNKQDAEPQQTNLSKNSSFQISQDKSATSISAGSYTTVDVDILEVIGW
jgi:flagellar biosynthesis GTPase FlhF